jgi:hypothetical protein
LNQEFFEIKSVLNESCIYRFEWQRRFGGGRRLTAGAVFKAAGTTHELGGDGHERYWNCV